MNTLTDNFLAKINQFSNRTGLVNRIVTRVVTTILPTATANAACSCLVYDSCQAWDSNCDFATNHARPWRRVSVCCTHFPCDPTCQDAGWWQYTYYCSSTCA
jgi:hypothetical protein